MRITLSSSVTPNVGSFVWGTLAEDTNRVAGVQYSNVDSYKLISKYSKNEPSLQEVTAGQAICLPVIEDVVSDLYAHYQVWARSIRMPSLPMIPTMSTTCKGKKYKKADLIAALKAAGVNVKTNSTDETLIKALNSLSDEEEAEVLSKLTPEV